MSTPSPSPLVALLDPATRADPYPLMAAVRAAGPVPIGPLPGVVLARHRDIAAVFRDPAISADRMRSPAFAARVAALGAAASGAPSQLNRSFLFLDPPDHTRLRRLVSQAFTARVVEGLAPRIAAVVDELLDAAADRGHLEVVADLAYPLPIRIIGELLGVPEQDTDRVRGWSQELTRALDPVLVATGEPATDVARRLEAFGDMREYVTGLVQARRTRPGADLVSGLVAARDAGERLSFDEVLSTVALLVVAGHETTVNLIGNGVLAVLRHPEVLERLAVDPAYAGALTEEVLRFDPPVQLSMRNALEPRVYGEVEVPAGGLAVLLLAAAARDPEVHPRPEVFDPDRFDPGRGTRHLSFGLGPHFCLGAPLARLEGRLALQAFARRVQEPVLASARLDYKPHVTLRGLAGLPVQFSAIRPATPAR